ncbi:PepSY domain-containing protein [Corynebacterium sp.]|uniref:PepSY domain-containing protein n=1 Tax=Corynebacterium sp. TaxID=1720 RepID=UPI0026DFCECA|nr:PepSY domain-containing protein [Corynebacterium sp.]MDO5511296.1 PepSY domain-containing protein [Corynebacterium sp.]
MNTRSTLALICVGGLALGACTDSGTTTTTVTETTTATAAATPTTEQTTATETTTTGDPVFAAIDAVLAAYPGGVITDIDREDGRVTYDIDVAVGDTIVELEVDGDGTIREDERDSDSDDVAKSRAATVTVADAISQALDQFPDGVLDEAELDEDDGVLRWEIDLDDADGNDLAELTFPAT